MIDAATCLLCRKRAKDRRPPGGAVSALLVPAEGDPILVRTRGVVERVGPEAQLTVIGRLPPRLTAAMLGREGVTVLQEPSLEPFNMHGLDSRLFEQRRGRWIAIAVEPSPAPPTPQHRGNTGMEKYVQPTYAI